MKKNFILFAAAMMAFVAVSCDKEEHLPDNHKDIILRASISNSVTKTSLGDKVNEQYPVLWSDGDQIAVFQGDAIFKFDLIEGDGTTTGVFKLDRNSSVEVEFSENESYTAIYPYSAIKENCNLIYEAPAIQQYVDNSFATGVSPMYANNDNSASVLTFANIFSILKLNIKGVAGEKVQKIQVGSNMPLAGDVQLESSPFSYQNSAYNITLDCGEGVDISQVEDFVIVIPPHSAMQLAIVITTDKGSYYKAATSDVTMTAGNILSMSVIDLGGEGSAQRSLMSINYPEDNKNGVFIGTKVWANVNCGYDDGHPYGLLYQWGRKYGQGYGSETPAVVNIYGNINADTYKGPLSSAEEGSSEDLKNNFYYHVDDWLATRDNTLWNTNITDNKEVYPIKNYSYDPCPVGWRVPTMGELEGLTVKKSDWTQTNGQYGYWFSGNVEYSNDAVAVFFPAAGHRSYWDGGVGNERGNIGQYVSSTATETDGWVCAASLEFKSDMIQRSNLRKTFGSSVRCVKDQTNLPASGAGTGGYGYANGGNDLEW